MSSYVFAPALAAVMFLGAPVVAGEDLVVEPGDTLGQIAKDHGVSVDAIADANGIDNPDFLRIGQTLVIPVAGGQGGGGGVATVKHVVQSGETLASIAVRYGASVSAIAEANAIANPDLILVGWSLTVTSGGGSGGQGGGGGGGGGGAAGTAQTYEVRPGDTIGNIAAAFGVPSNAILEVNDLANPNFIRIGQKLVIPTSALAGATRCPVPSGSFVDDYGYVKPSGKVHQGIDVFAPEGTEVHAPASGSVEQIIGGIGGLQFWLYSEDGTRYIGTHLVGFGDGGYVGAGDVVGYVGDTGNALGSPPHLHFEIAEDGTTINPYWFLVENC